MSSHRRLWAVAAALAALLALTSPAMAAKWDFAFSQTGVSGSAQSEFVCTDNGDGTETCSSSGIFVFAGRSKDMGTATAHVEQACYNDFSETFDIETGEFLDGTNRSGCTDAGDALAIDDLSSITLEATEISLVTVVCDEETCTEEPAGTVVVTGEWTGFGQISKQKSHSHFDDGVCVSIDSMRTNFRQADFTGTVDGEALDAEFAEMNEGTFSFRFGCAEEEE